MLFKKRAIPLKEEGPSESLMAAAREILNYLVEYPDAKDTMEGILKWWLPDLDPKWGEKEVMGALDLLVLKGWVNRLEIAPLQKIYSLNKDNLKAIKSFLTNNDDLRRGC